MSDPLPTPAPLPEGEPGAQSGGPDVIVLGAEGRIGALLMGMTRGPWRPVAVTRHHDPVGLHAPGPGRPIVVCTRNEDLVAVLDRVHPSRHPDLVLVQNGVVRPWMTAHGLSGATVGVLWVAVAARGDTPIAGGTSAFAGPWAATVAEMMDAHGVAARAVSEPALHTEVAIKLAWICIFGLLGEALRRPVGEIARDHRDLVLALAAELTPLLRQEPGLDLDTPALLDRLLVYSAAIAPWPARLREWPWRNGWLFTAAARQGMELPLHAEWAAKVGFSPSGPLAG